MQSGGKSDCQQLVTQNQAHFGKKVERCSSSRSWSPRERILRGRLTHEHEVGADDRTRDAICACGS